MDSDVARPASSARLRQELDTLTRALEQDARLGQEARAGLALRARRADALAGQGAWFDAASLLLEGAELERRATGARGAWWTLWLEVHDALVAGELGDWSA